MPEHLTPDQRSRLMARVRNKDTGIEVAVRRALHAAGLRFRKHARWLPGTPDIVFPRQRVTVFVDGDFWHGWHFPKWRHKLTPHWAQKIDGNRRRDRRNFARLRRQGWLVLRVWEHDVLSDPEGVADRIEKAVRGRSAQADSRSPRRQAQAVCVVLRPELP